MGGGLANRHILVPFPVGRFGAGVSAFSNHSPRSPGVKRGRFGVSCYRWVCFSSIGQIHTFNIILVLIKSFKEGRRLFILLLARVTSFSLLYITVRYFPFVD